jgi:hypothetical protein
LALELIQGNPDSLTGDIMPNSFATIVHLRRFLAISVLVMSFGPATAGVAYGQGTQYTFTRIVDTNDNAGLGAITCVGLNNRGTVSQFKR